MNDDLELRDVLLDLRAGDEPENVGKKYNLDTSTVKEIILYYFNGLSGEKLVSLTPTCDLSDSDKEKIVKLNEIGANKNEIADILSKSVYVIDRFLKQKQGEDKMKELKKGDIIETNEEFVQKIILKNNTIEVNTYPDRKKDETNRLSIFKDMEDYLFTINSSNEFIEERIKIFVDNNFNKNKYDSTTYNELFKFFTDFYHTSPILIAAITKVLYERRVNFVIVYYNKETKMHHYQWIWNFNDNQISIFDTLLKDNRNIKNDVFIHGNPIEDFEKSNTLYCVKIQDSKTMVYHFFIKHQDCFKFYGDQIVMSKLTESDNLTKLYINQYSNNGLCIKRTASLAMSNI